MKTENRHCNYLTRQETLSSTQPVRKMLKVFYTSSINCKYEFIAKLSHHLDENVCIGSWPIHLRWKLAFVDSIKLYFLDRQLEISKHGH